MTARIRTIKPEFFTDEDLAELSIETRLLFVALWTLADREGRLEDKPRTIKIASFPWDDVDVEACLGFLASGGFIERYEVDGKRYIQIVNFSKHQRPNHREAESEIPSRACPGVPVRARGEGKGREGKGTKNTCPETLEKPSVSGLPAVLTFPTDGTPNTWDLTEPQLEEWKKLFPTLDVLRHCRDALAWVQSKPANHKTARGMKTFLTSWLIRQQDRPKPQGPPEAPQASPRRYRQWG